MELSKYGKRLKKALRYSTPLREIQFTYTKMSVNTRISRCPSEILILLVGYMCICFGVTVSLCQAKINHVNLVATFSDTHEEVVWLNIPMNESFGMTVFNTRELELTEGVGERLTIKQTRFS